MSTTTLNGFLTHLKQSMGAEALAERTDGALVERFLRTRDEAAFTAMLRRHGPMVLRVCRRVLPRPHDAEDAFQATFLVLARRAGMLRKRASLASWLHGVAHRVALEARGQSARRRRLEGRSKPRTPTLPDDIPWRELRVILDEELSRLPERLRAPLILCYLEGLTQDEAARQLAQSKSTCRRNLERGKEALAARLNRRGVVWPAALAAILLSDCVAPAAPPAGLVGSTLAAASCFAAGQAPAISAKVALLTQGVTKAMFISKFTNIAATLLAVVVLSGVFAVFSYTSLGQERKTETGPDKQATAAKPEIKKRSLDARWHTVLETALKDADNINEPFHRLVAYGHIAKMQNGAGKHDEAVKVLAKALAVDKADTSAEAAQHRDSRTSQLAVFHAEIGDVKGALHIATNEVSEMNRDHALGRVAAVQAQNKDLKGALETLQKVEEEPYKIDALRHIGLAQVEAGHLKGAAETAGRIGDKSPFRATVLAAIACARAKANDRKAAQAMLPEIREAARQGDHPARFFGFMAVAEAEAAAGKGEEAIKTAMQIDEDIWRDRALQRVAAGQAARGELSAARRSAEAIVDRYNKGEAEREIAAALIDKKDLVAAVKAIKEITHDKGRCYALLHLAKAQAAAGRKADARQSLEEALKLAEGLENPEGFSGVREAALAHHAGARAAIGDADAALKWAGEHPDPWVRIMARVRVIQEAAKVTPE